MEFHIKKLLQDTLDQFGMEENCGQIQGHMMHAGAQHPMVLGIHRLRSQLHVQTECQYWHCIYGEESTTEIR